AAGGDPGRAPVVRPGLPAPAGPAAWMIETNRNATNGVPMFPRLSAILLVLCCLSCSDSGSDAEALSGGDPAAWPQRPLRVIIPFGPGGLADVTLRLAGEKIGEAVGQTLVMENRPGAGGVAATSTMLNNPADG